MNEIALVEVFRFNPKEDDQYRLDEFKVPYDPQKTVLEILQYIYEEKDRTIAFRGSCRSGFCNICGITVNGRPCLACTTCMEKNMVLEPLSNHDVIRDLVVEL